MTRTAHTTKTSNIVRLPGAKTGRSFERTVRQADLPQGVVSIRSRSQSGPLTNTPNGRPVTLPRSPEMIMLVTFLATLGPNRRLRSLGMMQGLLRERAMQVMDDTDVLGALAVVNALADLWRPNDHP